MYKIALIAAGGAVGAVLRYGLSGWTQKLANGPFPTGTLAVNVVGCGLIGLAAAYFAGPQLIREEYRVALLIGILGAFTTFSTFGLETINLAGDGRLGLAALNVLASNGVGLAAVWIGYRLGTKWFGV